MRKSFVLLRRQVALLGVFCLTFAGHPAQQTPPATSTPAQPMLLGVNYYAGLWSPNETTVLGYLPISIVRWGGDASDTGENSTGLVKVFLNNIGAVHNAQPLYQIPFLNESPADEARQVIDINLTNKMGIKYWEIGNEPELFQSVMQQNVSLNDYLKGWRADAQAMLAADPSISLVGPDVSLNLTPIDKSSRAWQWFDAFIKANGDLIKIVTIHFYPFTDTDQSLDTIFGNAALLAQNLAMLRSYLHDTLQRDVPLMITETNLNAHDSSSQNISDSGLYAGLWLADTIGTAAQQGVAAVLVWDAVRNGSFSLLSDTGAQRPTFYALQAYTGLGSTVDTPAGLPPGVHGCHSQASSGESIEVLINTTAQPVPFSVGGKSITLGAYSITRLHFDVSGKLADGTTYGQTEFKAQHPASDALHSSS